MAPSRSKPSPGPEMPHVRTPMERMLRIHRALLANHYTNASKLAREVEVSAKTIHRDLEFMRDRLNLPLEYDSSRKGYYYVGEVSSFPTLQITEGEIFALVVAEKALQQYRGTSFEGPLLSAIRKMEQALPDTISLNLADLEQTISFRTRAEPILNLGIFEVLARAVSQRQQLELHYRKPGQQTAEARLVDPYHLANINGEWFLFAYDHVRKDIRTFSRRASRPPSPRARASSGRRSFRWRSACATALACIPVKANSTWSSSLRRGPRITSGRRNGMNRRSCANCRAVPWN